MAKGKIQIRCSDVEQAAYNRAAFPLTVSEWVRSILNPRVGLPAHPTPNKPKPKAPKPVKTHCGYSGLPKDTCLCKRCTGG